MRQPTKRNWELALEKMLISHFQNGEIVRERAEELAAEDE